MNLFPLPQVAQPVQGLFSNLRTALDNPAVKAGLLQAGMSMLNPNPNSSPFAQIFTGVNEGIQANQRYKDLVTQREIEKNKLLAEQQREDLKNAMRARLDDARLRQIENSIDVSQRNAGSLTELRKAQTERAKRGPAGSAAGSRAFDSAWRAFYRKKVEGLFGGDSPTPDQITEWKSEFDALEAQTPGRAGTAGLTAPTAPSAPVDPEQRAIAIREAMELYGWDEEQAAQEIDSLFVE